MNRLMHLTIGGWLLFVWVRNPVSDCTFVFFLHSFRLVKSVCFRFAADFNFLAEMPRLFPNIAGSRVVLALAATWFLDLPNEENAPVMTFFKPAYLRKLRSQHPRGGNMHPILGFGELLNLTIGSPNGALFGAAFNEAKLYSVSPRVEYLQHYQTVHHSFLGDKELIPGNDHVLTSKRPPSLLGFMAMRARLKKFFTGEKDLHGHEE